MARVSNLPGLRPQIWEVHRSAPADVAATASSRSNRSGLPEAESRPCRHSSQRPDECLRAATALPQSTGLIMSLMWPHAAGFLRQTPVYVFGYGKAGQFGARLPHLTLHVGSGGPLRPNAPRALVHLGEALVTAHEGAPSPPGMIPCCPETHLALRVLV